MRDLTETVITYALALTAIVITYYAFSSVLTGLITQAFSNLSLAVH